MKGRDEMTGKKKFPYKTAVLICSGCKKAETETSCAYGCVGCGACEAACPARAVSVAAGIAEVNEELCSGCGMCVSACPQGVLRLHTFGNDMVVACANQDDAKTARQVCGRSCIGCGLCARTCTAEAIQVENSCAAIDEERCLNCGMCVLVCPRGAIRDLRGIVRPALR